MNIIPDKGTLYFTGITDNDFYKERFDFWTNVYGFKMTSMRKKCFTEIFFDYAKEAHLITYNQPIFNLDLNVIEKKDINFIC